MTQNAVHVGCDVSKDFVDVALLESGELFRVSNDGAGFGALRRRLGQRAVAVLGVEATGGYERDLVLAMLAAGYRVRRINPCRLRRFAQGIGLKAKNDRLDAGAIARYVATVPLEPVVHRPEVDRLAELVLVRRQLREDLNRAHNQAGHARDELVKALGERRSAWLKAEIAQIDAAIDSAIAEHPELADKDRLLRSVPGVGPVFSATLLALMPELGRISGRQAASLLGVAPFDHDSGRLRGQRCIDGGRQRVRNVAYMAALAAARHNPTLRAMKRRLSANGKKPKVIIVALMRRLIVILNAMIRDRQTWNPAQA